MYRQAAVAAFGPLDPIERRVEDGDATTKDEVFVRLDVACPHAGQRVGLDGELRG